MKQINVQQANAWRANKLKSGHIIFDFRGVRGVLVRGVFKIQSNIYDGPILPK